MNVLEYPDPVGVALSRGSSTPVSPRVSFYPLSECPFKREDDLEVEREAISELYNIFHNHTNFDERVFKIDESSSICCAVGVFCHDRSSTEASPNRVSVITAVKFEGFSRGTVYVPASINRLRFLTFVNFHECRVTHVEEGAFDDLPLLSSVLLSSNFISNLDGLLNPNLEMLNVAGNSLVSIQGLEKMVGLKTLFLANNPQLFGDISSQGEDDEVDPDLSVDWGKLKKLNVLRLSSTGLSFVTPNFCNAANISQLYLSYNPIPSLPECFSQLQKLEVLDLASSQISEFPTFLSDLPSLFHLGLFPSLIQEFPEEIGAFPILKQLRITGPYIRVVRGLSNTIGVVSLVIFGTPNLVRIDASAFGSRRLNTVVVNGAPLLTEVPSLSLAFSANDIFFTNTGIERFTIEQDYHLLSFKTLTITNSRLKNITSPYYVDISKTPRWALSNLDLSRNQIDHIRPSLCRLLSAPRLDLSNNPLRYTQLEGCQFSDELSIRNSQIERLYTIQENIDARDCPNLRGTQIHTLSLSNDQKPIVDMRGRSRITFENMYIANRQFTSSELVGYKSYDLTLVYEKKILCYPVLLVDPGHWAEIARVLINPEQLDYKHCRCMDDDMVWDDEEKLCHDAETVPPEMFCNYNDSIAAPLYVVRSGYYPTAVLTSNDHDQTDDALHSLSLCPESSYRLPQCGFVECILTHRCNPQEESPFRCSGGFNENSTMCSLCPEGFFESAHSCQECTESIEITVPVLFSFAIVALVLYTRKAHSRDATKSVTFATVSIFLSYVQMSHIFTWISITAESSPTTSSAARWWETVTGFFYTLVPTSASCMARDVDYIDISYLILSLPLAVALLLMVFAGTLFVFKSLSMHRLSLIVYFYLFALQTSYLSVSSRVLSIFNCIETGVSDISVLARDPSISCSSTRYLQLRVAAICGIFLYVIGIPAFLFGIVRVGLSRDADAYTAPLPIMLGEKGRSQRHPSAKHRKGDMNVPLVAEEDSASSLDATDSDHDGEQQKPNRMLLLLLPSFRMLGSCHRQRYPYWSVTVVMLRRLLIVCTVSLLHPRSILIPVFILVLVLASLLVQWEYRPYAHIIDNFLESTFLSLAYFTYAIGTFSSSTSTLRDIDVMFTTAVIINISVVCLFVVVLPLARLGLLCFAVDSPEDESDHRAARSGTTSNSVMIDGFMM